MDIQRHIAIYASYLDRCDEIRNYNLAHNSIYPFPEEPVLEGLDDEWSESVKLFLVTFRKLASSAFPPPTDGRTDD